MTVDLRLRESRGIKLADMALGGHIVSVVDEKKNEYSEAEFIQLRKRIANMQYDFEMEDRR